jgi:hypothetical protein
MIKAGLKNYDELFEVNSKKLLGLYASQRVPLKELVDRLNSMKELNFFFQIKVFNIDTALDSEKENFLKTIKITFINNNAEEVQKFVEIQYNYDEAHSLVQDVYGKNKNVKNINEKDNNNNDDNNNNCNASNDNNKNDNNKRNFKNQQNIKKKKKLIILLILVMKKKI